MKNEKRARARDFRIGKRERAILEWIGSLPWDTDNPAEMAKRWGVSSYRVWEAAQSLKRKGLLVDAPPYAITTVGRQVLTDLSETVSGSGSGTESEAASES